VGVLVLVYIHIRTEIRRIVSYSETAELGNITVTGYIAAYIAESGGVFPPLARLVTLQDLARFVIVFYVIFIFLGYLRWRA